MTNLVRIRNLRRSNRCAALKHHGLAAILLSFCLVTTSTACALDAPQRNAQPLRIAVYDIAPYGYLATDGLISGVSVDLWRRVAEQIGQQFKLVPVSNMEAILSGLEHDQFDAAIGAITITPERAERVDFSYPAHRSGVAVALRKEIGPVSALRSYLSAVSELSPLILFSLVMLIAIGLAMWIIERPRHALERESESSVATIRDGLYWAVVTMTTVGYGDKTPKTTFGRAVAILWMMGSVVLVSLVSTSLVSRLTAERVETREIVVNFDFGGKRLAAVAQSSGAEYLDHLHLQYAKFKDLPEALDSLADGRSDAVVNSIGSLQYLISKHYSRVLEIPRGLLAPAYMAFALPKKSELKGPIDRALIKVTTGPEWRSLEERFFTN